MRKAASSPLFNIALATLSAFASLPGANAGGSAPWTLPGDPGLQTDGGCFAELTCSDRIALSRIAARLDSAGGQAVNSAIAREELRKLSASQRTRILRAILAGTSAQPLAVFTELTDEDLRNIEAVEAAKHLLPYSAALRDTARKLAEEARSIRDAGLASHLWMIVSDGTEAAVSAMLGSEPEIELIALAHRYRDEVAQLELAVRDALLRQRLSPQRQAELKTSYRKRIDQLSEQLVLEIEQANAAVQQSRATAIVPLELIAEAGFAIASSGASSIGVRSAMRAGALAGFSSTAWNAARAAHSAYAGNDAKFFCELSDHALANPAMVDAALGGLAGGLLGKLVAAESFGVRAIGGALGIAAVSGATTWVEVGRWDEAQELGLLADAAHRAGKADDAACFLLARDQQLAGIAIDVTTLAAGYALGASKRPTASQEAAARETEEMTRRSAERLNARLYGSSTSNSQKPASTEWSASDPVRSIPETLPIYGTAATSSRVIFSEDIALKKALQEMKTLEDFLDIALWERLWVRAAARDLGESMIFVLTSRMTQGRAVIFIKNADADAAAKAITRAQSDAIYEALTKGGDVQIDL